MTWQSNYLCITSATSHRPFYFAWNQSSTDLLRIDNYFEQHWPLIVGLLLFCLHSIVRCPVVITASGVSVRGNDHAVGLLAVDLLARHLPRPLIYFHRSPFIAAVFEKCWPPPWLHQIRPETVPFTRLISRSRIGPASVNSCSNCGLFYRYCMLLVEQTGKCQIIITFIVTYALKTYYSQDLI